MFEYSVIVSYRGAVIFRTEWHVGVREAREVAWLLATKLGDGYDIGVRARKEDFVATPWEVFGLDAEI